MNTLIRKEIRLLLGPWICAMAVTILPVWVYAESSAQMWVINGTAAVYATRLLSQYCLVAAVMMIALTAFGYEFTAKTFSLFLSQPIPRQSLWRSKTIVLAVAMISVIALHLLTLEAVLHFYTRHTSFRASIVGELADASRAAPIIGLIAYAGGLWTTLVFRNIAAALSVTIIAPLFAAVFEHWFSDKFAPGYQDVLLPWAFVGYAVAGFAFARIYFLRAQDVALTGGTLVFSSRRTGAVARWMAFRRSGRFVAVIQKEVQLQQVSLLIAGLILGCHVLSFPLRIFSPKTSAAYWYLIKNVWLLWLALPLLIGCSIVAEERRLGTLESLLTAPVSRRAQFVLKVLMTLALSMFFGAVVPWEIEKVWNLFGPVNELISWSGFGFNGLLLASTIVAMCAMFASTVSRHTLEAICLAVVVTPIVVIGLNFVSQYGRLAYITFGIVLPVTVFLGWRNYQRTQLRSGDFALTFTVLSCSVVLGWGALSFTYHRAWELFMPLEPRHGAAVFHRGDRLKVFTDSFGSIALLPDGRIWRSENVYDEREEKLNNGRVVDHHIVAITPTNAMFIEGTNWMTLAVGPEPFAIKSDGTLWHVAEFKADNNNRRHHHYALPPRQVGHDTNWVSLETGTSYILALKQDGTLWGWGENWSGQLGPGATKGIPIAKEIWPGTKWAKVFAAGPVCFGFDSNGTVWTWGGKPPELGDDQTVRIMDYRPEPSPFRGTNWIGFRSTSSNLKLGLRADGTLWYVGVIDSTTWRSREPEKILGEPIVRDGKLHQLGQGGDWQKITASGTLSGLKQSGDWIVGRGDWIGRHNEQNFKISHYSDWLDISSSAGLIGIAADGTISCWEYLDTYPYVLAPSRRPAWSANIFATR
jgi:ABC-type transport system involved in multi-copper enzyme maturation permease subunit